MRFFRFAIAAGVAAGALLCAADAPYIGNWKLNPDKSKLSGGDFVIEKLPSGEYRYDGDGYAYNFKLDGKEYPLPDGGTAAWTAPDASTWKGVIKVNGKLVATMTGTVAGDMMTFVSEMMGPDGGKVGESTSKNMRLSGGPGPVGKWRNTQAKQTATGWDIEQDGPDGLIMTQPEFKIVCKVKLNGADTACTGPTATKNWTYAVKKSGPGLEITEKMNGKPMFIDKVRVIGPEMIWDTTVVANQDKTKSVYERM